jgi:hypothetical protein
MSDSDTYLISLTDAEKRMLAFSLLGFLMKAPDEETKRQMTVPLMVLVDKLHVMKEFEHYATDFLEFAQKRQEERNQNS